MATTKTLLEKAMLRLGSRGARGDANSLVNLDFADTTDYQKFIASADGFVVLTGTTQSSGGRDLAVVSSAGRNSTTAVSGMGCMTSIAVQKGETYLIRIRNMQSQTHSFIKSIGGGYNRLLTWLTEQGGALWQRLNLCSMLSQKRVANGHSQKETKSKSEQHRLTQQTLNRGLTNLSTPPLAMALFGAATLTPNIRTLLAQTQERTTKVWRTHSAGFGSLFAKDGKQFVRLLTRLRSRLFTLCRCSVKSSFALEGGF